MSEDETVLGKRARTGHETEGDQETSNPNVEGQEDSDDDVGPMPMPANAADTGTMKKKRKGEYSQVLAVIESPPHSVECSATARETLPGPFTECRPLLQEFHAQRCGKFCGHDKVRGTCEAVSPSSY